MANNNGEVTARGQRAGRLDQTPDIKFPTAPEYTLDTSYHPLMAETELARAGLPSTLVNPPAAEPQDTSIPRSVRESSLEISQRRAAGAPLQSPLLRTEAGKKAWAGRGGTYETLSGEAFSRRQALIDRQEASKPKARRSSDSTQAAYDREAEYELGRIPPPKKEDLKEEYNPEMTDPYRARDRRAGSSAIDVSDAPDYDELTTREGGVADIRQGSSGGSAVGEILRSVGAQLDPVGDWEGDFLTELQTRNKQMEALSNLDEGTVSDPRPMTLAAFTKKTGLSGADVPEVAAPKPGTYERIAGSGRRKASYRLHLGNGEVQELDEVPTGRVTIQTDQGQRTVTPSLHDPYADLVPAKLYKQIPVGPVNRRADPATVPGTGSTRRWNQEQRARELRQESTVAGTAAGTPQPAESPNETPTPGRGQLSLFDDSEVSGAAPTPVPDRPAPVRDRQAGLSPTGSTGLSSQFRDPAGQLILPLRMPEAPEDVTVPATSRSWWNGSIAPETQTAVRRRLTDSELREIRSSDESFSEDRSVERASGEAMRASTAALIGTGERPTYVPPTPQPIDKKGQPIEANPQQGTSLREEHMVLRREDEEDDAGVDLSGDIDLGSGPVSRRTFAWQMGELMRQAGSAPSQRGVSTEEVVRPRDTDITDADGISEDNAYTQHREDIIKRYPSIAEHPAFEDLATHTFVTGRDISAVWDPSLNDVKPARKGELEQVRAAALHTSQGRKKTATPGSIVTSTEKIESGTPDNPRTRSVHKTVYDPSASQPIPSGEEMTPVGRQRLVSSGEGIAVSSTDRRRLRETPGAPVTFRRGEVATRTQRFLDIDRRLREQGKPGLPTTALRSAQNLDEINDRTRHAVSQLMRGENMKTRSGAERTGGTPPSGLMPVGQGEDTPTRKVSGDIREIAASHGYIRRQGETFVEGKGKKIKEVTPERAEQIMREMGHELARTPDQSGMAVVQDPKIVASAQRTNAGMVSDTGEVEEGRSPLRTDRVTNRRTTVKNERVKDGRTSSGVTEPDEPSSITEAVPKSKAQKIRRSASAEARRQRKEAAKRKPESDS